MNSSLLTYILSLCIVLQVLIWTITDPRPFKERIKSYLSLRVISYFLIFWIGFVLSIYNSIYVPWPFLENSLVTFMGLILFFTGYIIALWAKFTMRSIWGIPKQHDIKRQNKLVTNGPFTFSRNPIYLGLILTYLGFFLVLKSYLVFLALVAYWYFNKAAEKEEQLLEKHFGKEYLNYKAKVPRFF